MPMFLWQRNLTASLPALKWRWQRQSHQLHLPSVDVHPHSQYRNTGWGACSGLSIQGRRQAQMGWWEGCSGNAQMSSLLCSQSSLTCPSQQPLSHPVWSQQQLFYCRRKQSSVVLTTIVRLHLPQSLLNVLKGWFSSTLRPASQTLSNHISLHTEDAIATAFHTALLHLEHPGSYVRMFFIDYSSAFNTVHPARLAAKLLDLGLSPSICHWIKDFLTIRTQR